MAMQVTAGRRRDPDVLYDWLEANLRYRMTGPAPTSSDADAGSHKTTVHDRWIMTLQALLDELDPTDHERVLRFATGKRFQEEQGPVDAACNCRWCAAARARQEAEMRTPREQRIRESLVKTLDQQLPRSPWARLHAAEDLSRRRKLRIEMSPARPFPAPAVNPAFVNSRAPLRWFFGKEPRLAVYLEMVPPAWPLLVRLLGLPLEEEDAEYPMDVPECALAVAAHMSYAPVVRMGLQRKVLGWTWHTPKAGWRCHVPQCSLPKPLPRTELEVPEDWLQHKFAHALHVLLLDALRHKWPVNRGLGMPLIDGLWGNVDIPRILSDSPYAYYAGY